LAGGSFPRDMTDLKAGWLWQAGEESSRSAGSITLSIQGAAWGGGSLIYANVFARPLRVYDLGRKRVGLVSNGR
jgi:cholesterol oxidase